MDEDEEIYVCPEEDLAEVRDDEVVDTPPSRNREVLEPRSSEMRLEEVELLAELYVQNKDQYHSKFKTGSKLSKSTQDELAQEWAISLSELGFAPRTAGQVKQKILDMEKKARKYLSDEERDDQDGRREVLQEARLELASSLVFRHGKRRRSTSADTDSGTLRARGQGSATFAATADITIRGGIAARAD
ncbi:hypothetical protein Aduo_015265 [Ancylostoma duodenale]